MENTNQVFILDFKDKASLYIPAYLNLVLKDICNLCFEDQEAELNLTLIFTACTRNLPPEIIEIIRTQVILMFDRNDSILLD